MLKLGFWRVLYQVPWGFLGLFGLGFQVASEGLVAAVAEVSLASKMLSSGVYHLKPKAYKDTRILHPKH